MTLDARRLVRACLLAFAVFLATGGVVVGMAAADAEDDLVVPEPRPGDRATYSIRQVVLDEGTARGDLSSLTEVTYEWLPEVTAMDRSFGQRSAHPLRASYLQGSQTFTGQTTYDGVTGAPLFGVHRGSENFTDGTHFGILLEDLVGSDGSTVETESAWYTGALGPCAARAPFTHLPAAGKVIDFAGNCDWPAAPPTLAFRAKGWKDDGFLFTAVKDADLRVWYDGHAPFPLRMQVPLGDLLPSEYTSGRVFLLERVAFERGEAAYSVPGALEGLGPAPTAARPEWGIPDDGIDHPFPLSRAFQTAMAETDDAVPMPGSGSDPTVAEFYASRPDAYLGFAAFTDLLDQQGQAHHTWWLLFTDGAQHLGKVVKLEPRGGYGLFVPSQAGLATSVEDWEPTFVSADERGYFPTRDHLPERMPVAQALLERHDASGGVPANAYGFIVRCDGDCDHPVAEAVAAHAVADLGSDVSFLVGSFVEDTAVAETTWVGSDGALVRHYRAAGQKHTPIPVVRSAVDPDQGGRGTGPDLLTAGFSAPVAGAAAASISLLSLLIALVYYFWPSLKGALGVGLFSRTEDGKLLEHPTRRRIQDAIEGEPGIHFQALARKAGVGRGNLDHHLRKLVAADLVTVRRAPGYTCYFPKGRLDRRYLDAAHAVRSDGSKAVLQAVAGRPGASSRDLAQHLGMAPSTVSYHLKRLETAGLVAPGERAGVHLTPLGSQAAA